MGWVTREPERSASREVKTLSEIVFSVGIATNVQASTFLRELGSTHKTSHGAVPPILADSRSSGPPVSQQALGHANRWRPPADSDTRELALHALLTWLQLERLLSDPRYAQAAALRRPLDSDI